MARLLGDNKLMDGMPETLRSSDDHPGSHQGVEGTEGRMYMKSRTPGDFASYERL
jgi:hypothetical protein